MKMIGPNTEPWGTPVASRVGDADLQHKHETVKSLSDRYEETKRGHCREDQTTKISVAAEWSGLSCQKLQRGQLSRVRQVTSCLSMALMRSSCNANRAVSVECVLWAD